MFGFGKTKSPTGAREKIELAKQMRAAGRYNSKEQGGGDTRYPSQTVAITIIYVLATVLAMMLTDNKSNPLSGMHFTGIPSFDNFVTGGDITAFTGDPDEDRLFTILGRGAAFFVLAGFVPIIAFVLEKLFFSKRIMPIVLCWGVIIILMLLYLCIPLNSIIPFIKSL